MRLITIVLLLSFVLPSNICFSQTKKTAKYIIAEHKTNGQKYIIDYSATVKVKLKDDAGQFKGGISISSDSTISISGMNLLIDNIEQISYSKTLPKVVGGVFIGVGAIGTLIGVVNKQNAKIFPADSLAYLLANSAGNAFIVMGSSSTLLGVVIASVKRKFTARNYNFVIRGE